tara:strand:+ start:93 stop:920 length:828 start_codon:yes stop_codon:yes gene_type:complete
MRYQVGTTPKKISAGSFDPEAPKRFAASPEALGTIQRIKDKHGLTVEILPFEEGQPSWARGYFRSIGPGGSNDPKTRRVYLGDNPALFVLEHELGHAVDPQLHKSNQFIEILEKQFFDKYQKGELETPAKRLEYSMLGMPRRKLDTELTAQKYALDRMKERGLEDDLSKQDLRQYPLAYIDQGIRRSQLGEMFEDGPLVPDSVAEKMAEVFSNPYGDVNPGSVKTSFMPNANTVVDFGDRVVNKLLELSLDKNYQKTAQKEVDRARTYATRRMGY